MTDLQKQINRIKRNEKLLDEANEIINEINASLDKLDRLETITKRLINYSQKDFMDDYMADEDGLLPKDLKRGVLSEDAISDLLEEKAELLEKLREL